MSSEEYLCLAVTTGQKKACMEVLEVVQTAVLCDATWGKLNPGIHKQTEHKGFLLQQKSTCSLYKGMADLIYRQVLCECLRSGEKPAPLLHPISNIPPDDSRLKKLWIKRKRVMSYTSYMTSTPKAPPLL